MITVHNSWGEPGNNLKNSGSSRQQYTTCLHTETWFYVYGEPRHFTFWTAVIAHFLESTFRYTSLLTNNFWHACAHHLSLFIFRYWTKMFPPITLLVCVHRMTLLVLSESMQHIYEHNSMSMSDCSLMANKTNLLLISCCSSQISSHNAAKTRPSVCPSN